MPKFFISKDQIEGDIISILGEDAHHISRSLRMAVGENIVVSDEDAFEYDCVLESFLDGCVKARILESHKSDAESQVKIHLFQALPKGEKLDLIIQKSVECGAFDVTPFESERCIAKVKGDNENRKTERRSKIALEAAKQCGRGIIPTIHPTISFSEMLNRAKKSDVCLFCYEGEETAPLGKVLKELREKKEILDVSIIIGSEGGFSPAEAKLANDEGAIMIGLGKRILRAETAAILALSCLVYEFELT